LLQENMVSFVKEQLKDIQRALSPDELACLVSLREDEDEEQRDISEDHCELPEENEDLKRFNMMKRGNRDNMGE
ncbi:uncharacterized protein LOC127140878 isoform X4, partial [Xyrichtys novacula]